MATVALVLAVAAFAVAILALLVAIGAFHEMKKRRDDIEQAFTLIRQVSSALLALAHHVQALRIEREAERILQEIPAAGSKPS